MSGSITGDQRWQEIAWMVVVGTLQIARGVETASDHHLLPSLVHFAVSTNVTHTKNTGKCWKHLAPSPTVLPHDHKTQMLRRRHQVSLFQATSANNTCRYVSYRGYGPSEGSPSEAGLKLDAETALEFCMGYEHFDLSKLFVFGRSLGGAVAIDVASKHQDKVCQSHSSFEISLFLDCWVDCGEYLYIHRGHGALHPPFSQTPLPHPTVPCCQMSRPITLLTLVPPICCFATSGITKKRSRRSRRHLFSFSLLSRHRFPDDNDVTY